MACARGAADNVCASVQSITHSGRYSSPHINAEHAMNLSLSIAPLVALLAGILILVVPRLLNYIVAIYLILIGLIGLFGGGALHLR
jgi:hypothetical protein